MITKISSEDQKVVFPKYARDKKKGNTKTFVKESRQEVDHLEQTIRQNLSIHKYCINPDQNRITKDIFDFLFFFSRINSKAMQHEINLFPIVSNSIYFFKLLWLNCYIIVNYIINQHTKCLC